MATAPTPTKAKRKSGPRVVKDKIVYMLFKGNIEEMHLELTSEAALDKIVENPSLVMRKVVIPAKKSTRTTPTTDAPVAQAA